MYIHHDIMSFVYAYYAKLAHFPLRYHVMYASIMIACCARTLGRCARHPAAQTHRSYDMIHITHSCVMIG